MVARLCDKYHNIVLARLQLSLLKRMFEVKVNSTISVLFVCLILLFTSHQQYFSYKGTGLPVSYD